MLLARLVARLSCSEALSALQKHSSTACSGFDRSPNQRPLPGDRGLSSSISSVGGTRLGAPGGTFAPLALTNGMPLGILKWEAYTCAGRAPKK